MSHWYNYTTSATSPTKDKTTYYAYFDDDQLQVIERIAFTINKSFDDVALVLLALGDETMLDVIQQPRKARQGR